MVQIVPVDAVGGAPAAQQNALTDQSNSAFGLGFEDLLRIILTQLTYQDPLKPVENYEFVSQLAQFSQIQQGETTNERLAGLLQQGTSDQATGLLAARVELPAGTATLSGVVKSITFQNGEPRLTIETDDDRTISNIGLGAINRISEGE